MTQSQKPYVEINIKPILNLASLGTFSWVGLIFAIQHVESSETQFLGTLVVPMHWTESMRADSGAGTITQQLRILLIDVTSVHRTSCKNVPFGKNHRIKERRGLEGI